MVAVEDVRSGLETFDGVDNQVEMVELRSERIEEVGRYAARRPVEHGGELGQADRRACKLAARAATQDNLLDGRALVERGVRRAAESPWGPCYRFQRGPVQCPLATP